MRYFQILGTIGVLVLVIGLNKARADVINPCEYMNITANSMNQLDTGNDPNFERIKQQNNQAIVRACQEYEIKKLDEAKSDLNRDNY